MTSRAGAPHGATLPESWFGQDALLDAVGDGLVVTDAQGVIVFCNAPFAALAGHSAAALIGSDLFARFDPGARDELRRLQQAALASGAPQRTSAAGTGSQFTVRAVLRALPGCVLPGAGHVVWCFAELSKWRLPTPIEAAISREVGFWEIDVAADEVHWWSDWCEGVGIDPCLGAGHTEQWDRNIHPEDLDNTDSYWGAIEGTAEIYIAEYRVRTRSGGWRWVMSRGRAAARDATGRATHVVGVILDIDARKRAELALRESEARLEAALWGTQIGLWEEEVGHAFRWFDDWADTVDVTRSDGRDGGTLWRSLIHPDDLGPALRAEEDCHRGLADHYVVEYRIRTRSGAWRWLHERGKVTARFENGKARRFVGVCFDIDARKQVETALRNSESRLETAAVILETMREAVILIDMDGLVEFTNAAFDRMFGREPGASLGTAVSTLLNLRRQHSPRVSAIEAALRRFNGRTGSRDVVFRRGDGSSFVGRAIAATIELGGAKKSLVVIQDVSERKELEREIIEIANRERRRLGGDLHDGLGQELTGISLMLRGLAKRLNPEARREAPEVDEIIGLVNHAIQTVRTMAVGLSPVTRAHGGLLAALESLGARSQQNYGIEVRLRLLLRSPLTVTEAMATHLYLIAQEAITNAVKHGGAHLVTVTLGANRSLVILTVIDDGIGICTPLHETGMGVKIMEYRAGMIGGTVQLKRRGGGGTRMRCVCPQTAPETDDAR